MTLNDQNYKWLDFKQIEILTSITPFNYEELNPNISLYFEKKPSCYLSILSFTKLDNLRFYKFPFIFYMYFMMDKL